MQKGGPGHILQQKNIRGGREGPYKVVGSGLKREKERKGNFETKGGVRIRFGSRD